ncbi:MAG: glycoside hydrolase family 95 protein [Phycisphaerales bacterium]
MLIAQLAGIALGVVSLARVDGAWQTLSAPGAWEKSGVTGTANYDGFAWYRAFVKLPAGVGDKPAELVLGSIDDADETFVNGAKVGATGGMPPTPHTAWSARRSYALAPNTLHEGWNVIAVRVHDSGGAGGIVRGPLRLVTASSAIGLDGAWEFRVGDDASWAKPSDIDAAALAFLSRTGERAAGQHPASSVTPAAAPGGAGQLRYEQPAEEWTEALPVGNGRLGAMVFGGVERERIQLNEISVWARAPVNRVRHPAPGLLQKARELWFKGDVLGCQKIMQDEFMSSDLDASYQTLGDLTLTMNVTGAVTEYVRSLDPHDGVAVTRFDVGGRTITRTARPSADSDTIEIVIEQSASPLPMRIELSRVELDDGRIDAKVTSPTSARLSMQGRARNGEYVGVRYASIVDVTIDGGTLHVAEGIAVEPEARAGVNVEGASKVAIRVAAGTDFLGGNAAEKAMASLSTKPAIVAPTSKDQPCMIRLGAGASLAASAPVPPRSPVTTRLAAARAGQLDPTLVEDYLDFCTHLVRSASRPGSLPANLQGLWNEHLAAPWNADYHTNINLQMNYWPIEPIGEGSRILPLTDFIDRLAVDGRDTARALYSANGWVCHHTSDAWGFTIPVGLTVWGLWPHGGGWLVRHAWEHYCYTLDRDYLKDRAFPLMRGACEFYLDWLCEDPATGKLVGGPSTSPENSFVLDDGRHANVGMGNAMDQEIVWDCFTNFLDAAQVLGAQDDPVVVRVRASRERLAWPAIGADGRLQEWSRPFREAEPGHRHVSHLYGVYPSAQFTPWSHPAYLDAAKKSLATRLANGGGHTGWSRAWLICLTARMRDGEAAYGHLSKLIGNSTLPNLFDDHPPFQIDGNFGGLAGVCEMLLQSHEMRWQDGRMNFVIDVLPALPKAWPDGAFRLCARGGRVVEAHWAGGRIRELEVVQSSASRDLPLLLRLPAGIGANALRVASAGPATLKVAQLPDGLIEVRGGGTAVSLRFD